MSVEATTQALSRAGAMSLDDLAAAINATHAAVVDGLRTTLLDARNAGDFLITAKARLPHGSWLSWLAEHCPELSPQVAQRYMRIARHWLQLANTYSGTHLGVNEALAILADTRDALPGSAPSGTPPVTFRIVAISELHASDPGWKLDNAGAARKMRESFLRFGQLSALVVRETEQGGCEVVDGRRRLPIMRELGYEQAVVLDVGQMPTDDARKLALSLENGYDVDYAAVVQVMAGLMNRGATPEQLEGTCPWDAERIRYFGELATFDWSRFRRGDQGPSASAAPTLDEAETLRQAPAWEFCCPKCGTEWNGRPRPFRAGGMAMANARDRRSGRRTMRLVFDIDDHRALAEQLRALADAFGTTDLADTVAAAVRLASERARNRVE